MTLSDPSWWILNLKINAKSNSGKILELLTVPKFFKKGSVDILWKLQEEKSSKYLKWRKKYWIYTQIYFFMPISLFVSRENQQIQ